MVELKTLAGGVHLNGRVYDPQIGRFISADPIEGGNRYAYMHNNPLRYTDPTGFLTKAQAEARAHTCPIFWQCYDSGWPGAGGSGGGGGASGGAGDDTPSPGCVLMGQGCPTGSIWTSTGSSADGNENWSGDFTFDTDFSLATGTFSNEDALWEVTPPGYARLGHRPLDGLSFEMSYQDLRAVAWPVFDVLLGPYLGTETDLSLIGPDDSLWHEQIFYNGGQGNQFNEGFFGSGLFGTGSIGPDRMLQNPKNLSLYTFGPAIYMGMGLKQIDFTNPAGFSLYYNFFNHNCQDYTMCMLGGH